MKLTYKNKEIVLPDFLIVGAARSGTTSLYYYLNQHPKICMSLTKEPAFFVFMDQTFNNRITKIEEYVKLFIKCKRDQKLGEASTVYLYLYKTTINNIKKVYGDSFDKLKIIIILRNPITRAFSHYMWAVKTGIEDLSFEEAIKENIIVNRLRDLLNNFVYDYIGYGMYYKQVKAYLETFTHVKIILFDELVCNPQEVINGIFNFLGVSSMKINFKIYNISGKPNRFYGRLFYYLFWRDHYIKKMLRNVLPNEIKKNLSWKLNNLKEAISPYIFKKETLSHSLRKKLYLLYKEDLVKLANLLPNDQKKIIIKQWLQI